MQSSQLLKNTFFDRSTRILRSSLSECRRSPEGLQGELRSGLHSEHYDVLQSESYPTDHRERGYSLYEVCRAEVKRRGGQSQEIPRGWKRTSRRLPRQGTGPRAHRYSSERMQTIDPKWRD